MRWRISLCIAFVLSLSTSLVFANTLPEGWEVWPLELGATAEIKRDEEHKYQGESSLLISNPTGSLALALPGIDIVPGQTYQFKGWVRTELEDGQEVHLAVILFDADGNYLGEVESHSVTGKTDWNLFKLEVEAGNAITAVLACRIIGSGPGSVWLDEMEITQMIPFRRLQVSGGSFEAEDFVQRAQPLELHPDLLKQQLAFQVELSKTPEHNWVSRDKIRMYYTASFGSSPNVWLQLHGGERETNFYDQRDFAPYWGIRSFEIRDQFKYKDSTINGVFGRVQLDYSPYILTLTDDERGQFTIRNGLSLKDIPFASGSLASFIFREGQNYWVGSNYRKYFDKAALNTTILFRQQGRETLETNTAHSLNLKLKNGDITIDVANQNVPLSKDASVLLIAYKSNLESINYNLRYFNFAPDFAPQYRDKLPQFTTYSMRQTEGNIVDRYQGKQGMGITLNLQERALGGSVELDSWQELEGEKYRLKVSARSKVLDFNATANVLSKGHKYVNSYETRQYLQDYFRFECKLEKEIKSLLPITIAYNYELENYQGEAHTIGDLHGVYNVRDGSFKGLRLKVGFEDNSRLSKPRAYVETNWTLPNRVNIYYRRYTENIKDSPYFDSVRERYMNFDNQLMISIYTTFSR